MPGVLPTDKATVLLRAENLLSAKIAPWSDQVIVVADDFIPDVRPKVCLTLSMPGGNFDWSAQTGGGEDSVHYHGTIRVSIWATNRTDRNGHDKNTLTADDAGLFRIWKRILKAFTGSYLDETETGGTGMILISPLTPQSDTTAQKMTEESTGGSSHSANSRATMAIDFSADFKVDLTDA
jgi:hypothetical protein